MKHNMFCYQCQETAGCTGCTRVGVCGKTADVAAMQDLLVYVTKGFVRGNHRPAGAGSAGGAVGQSPHHPEFVYHHHQC